MKAAAILFILIMSAAVYPQSAEQICASERTQGEACYRQCCEGMGFSWSAGGCDVPDAQMDSVTSQCIHCTDSYTQCVENYDTGGNASSSGGSGCCATIMFLSLAGLGSIIIKS